MKKFLLFLFLFFIFLIVSGVFLFEKFVTIKGFKFFPNLYVEKLEIKFPYTDIFLSDLTYKEKTLKLNTVSVSVKTPPSYVYEPKIDLALIKSIVNIVWKIVYKLHFGIKIKNIYVKINDISLNFGETELKKGKLKTKYFQLYSGNTLILEALEPKAVFDLSKLELTEKGLKILSYPAELTVSVLRKHFQGFFKLHLRTNADIFLLGNLKWDRSIKLSTEGKILLDKNSPIVFNGNFTYDGFALDGKFSTFWKDYNLTNKNSLHWDVLSGLTLKGYGKLQKNFLNKCNLGLKTVFGYTFNGKTVYLSGLDTNWSVGFSGIYRKSLFLDLVNGNDTLKVVLKSNKLFALFNKFSLNRCSFLVKNLKGNLNYDLNQSTLSGNLTFENLAYGDKFSLDKTSLGINGKLPDWVNANFGGTISGSVEKKGKQIKGNLKGSVNLFGKEANFNFPQLVYDLQRNKTQVVIKEFKYQPVVVENVNVNGLLKEGNRNIELLFSKSWNGFINLNLVKPYIFIDLKGNFSVNQRKFNFSVVSQADKVAGNIELELTNFLQGNFQYIKQNGIYLLSSQNILKNFGKVSFKGAYNGKLLSLNFVSDLNIRNGTITLTAPSIINFDTQTGEFHLKALPFCVSYLYKTVLCTKNLEIHKKEKLEIELTSREEFPIELQLRGEIGKTYDVLGNLKIGESFINSLINPYGFEIRNSGKIPFVVSIKGKNPIQGLYVSSDTSFALYSKYFYKPIKGYLNLSANSGEGSLFFGLQNLLTGEIYGTASGNVNFSKLEGEFNLNLSNLPIRIYLENFVSSYLTADAKFKGKFNKKTLRTKGNVSVEGFVKLYSYQPPGLTSKEKTKSQKTQKTYKVNYKVKLLSRGPIYIKAPNGEATVTYNGFISNNGTHLRIFINFGKLNLFGKKYIISRSSVEIKNGKTYLDFYMTHLTSDRTVFLHIYGFLPVENLKLDISSVPPAPKNEILLYLVSGGKQQKGGFSVSSMANLPLAKVLLNAASTGVLGLVSNITSQVIGGVKFSFVPYFDPTAGMALGFSVEKDFRDFAKIGYNWAPLPDPRATYLWGSLKFLFGSHFRISRYLDGTISTYMLFSKDFGFPF
jgi:hypothetical protein